MGTNNNNPRNSRREFLKAASKLAVYTPPAMMVLANPSLAQVAQSGGRTTTTIPVTITDDEIQTLYTLSQTDCGPDGSQYGYPNKNGSC